MLQQFFFAAFKHFKSGKFVTFTVPFDTDKLEWILRNFICVGFNNLRYDMPLLWLSCKDQNTDQLKCASNDIINGIALRAIQSKYKFKIEPTRVIDLIDICPLRGSLKLYGARLHADRIEDVPWSTEASLEDWQIPITQDYCLNDLNLTELVYNNLTEQLKLREKLSEEYDRDLMSKSDAQIAETVITHEIRKLKGGTSLSKPKIKEGEIFRFQAPPNMKFQSPRMQEVLRVVETAEFRISQSGYLDRPEEIEALEIKLGNSIYRMGLGGLHSSETTVAIVADNEFDVIDRDVAGYYPSIIINCGLAPRHLGQDFLTVYDTLVQRRLEAKRSGDLAVSESLKIVANSTFGKTSNPYSVLRAPDVTIQIVLGGQLYLLMLIEQLETAGIPIVSANTDGFVMRCPKTKRTKADHIIFQWEKTTGFVTEETEYSAIYSRDVNAYLAIKLDGTVKGKNIYYDPWRAQNAKDRLWQFQKNPNCQISVEAVEKFILHGTPLAETIEACNDIRRFVAVKNVTGGAHKNGDYLGKVIRWYIAAGEEGTINYIANNHLVPDTQGARPIMDLPTELLDDIDYAYYVRRAEGMLKDMGYK